MAIRLAKKANGRRRRPAYLPMFATMNPTAYAAWRAPMDHTQVARPSKSELSQTGT
jgi:hypothetical protein